MPRFEDGRYRMRVISQGFGERDNGTQFFFLECEPLAQIKGGEAYEPLDKYPRTIKLAVTEKAAKYVADKLTNLGWPSGMMWSNLDPNVKGCHSFVDQEIEAVCESKPSSNGDGKIYENWDLPFGNRESIVSDASISRKLDAAFGLATPKAARPAAKPQPRKLPAKATVPAAAGNGASAESGDDIPF